MSEYIEPNVEAQEVEAVPASDVPQPFVDNVESEVPPPPDYIEPIMLDPVEESSEDPAPEQQDAPKKTAKKAAKK